MTIRVLSAADIDRALTAADSVDAMRSAFSQLSDGTADVPVRGGVDSEHGITLLMPAFLGRSKELGAKIVSLFPGNEDLPKINGAVLLLDAGTGRVKALLDGARLTAIRTAAGSALATELLADPEADVMVVFGAGTQGRSHIEIISATRRLREIRVVSRTEESAKRLVDDVTANLELLPPDASGEPPAVRVFTDPAEALAGATLVVAATTSTTPVFDGNDLEHGAHVNGVGSFRPAMQEVDSTVVRRARVVVDQREAIWEEAGDLIVPFEAGEVGRDVIDAELGEIVNGDAPQGRGDHEITFFKSVGSAAQDVAIAAAALRAADRKGLGAEVPF
jgi:ornithine cyclodeaminase